MASSQRAARALTRAHTHTKLILSSAEQRRGVWGSFSAVRFVQRLSSWTFGTVVCDVAGGSNFCGRSIQQAVRIPRRARAVVVVVVVVVGGGGGGGATTV